MLHAEIEPPTISTSPRYAELIEIAQRCYRNNRDPAAISDADIAQARLYAYAFRRHVIGVFDATRSALVERPPAGPQAGRHRAGVCEALEDLANQSMETVPRDFRALLCTLYRYHRGILRAIAHMAADYDDSHDPEVAEIAERFQRIVERTTSGNGIDLAQDTRAPEQESFVVPNLGITIVPLVYGDHHSWNLAYLAGDERNVPLHAHRRGVEIHLGYEPTYGETVLDDCRAAVDEGYAMPIPPQTSHGWIHRGEQVHHVPFVFGSLVRGGWGVFFDVEPRAMSLSDCRPVNRDGPPMESMVYIERCIAEAESLSRSRRTIVIPAQVTDRHGSGGLELAVSRVDAEGLTLPPDEFRIVSVARGRGIVSIEGIERAVAPHDHFGVPAGMRAKLRQIESKEMVVLDCVLRAT